MATGTGEEGGGVLTAKKVAALKCELKRVLIQTVDR